MASVMGICGGLVGPKSGNVEKALVLKALLKGSRERVSLGSIPCGEPWGGFRRGT